MPFGGLALRLGGTVLRFIQFAAAIVILGIFSYFLAILSKQHIYIETWVRAVEGLAGATALYTLLGVILTCFLGGISFFAGIAILLDVLFIGANIAIAYETRGGNQNCNLIRTEDSLRFGANGLGDPEAHDYTPSTYHACTLLKATFAIAIIQIILFFLSIFWQLAIARHHEREKRNNVPNTPVVAGQRRGFWRRRARADVEKNSYQNGNGYTTNNAVNY